MPTANPTGSPTPGPTPTPVPTNLPSMTTTVYPLPSPETAAAGPIVGADGKLWFVAWTGTANTFVKFAPAAQVFYPIPATSGAAATTIVLGPDGALWSTLNEGSTGLMARVDTSGNVTTYPLPDRAIISMTVGGDGNLWYVTFTDSVDDAALRAFSPTSHAIVANLAIPAGTLGDGNAPGGLVFTNPKDGSLLISTGAPAGFLSVVPSTAPTISQEYATPFASDSIGGIAALGNKIYAMAWGPAFRSGDPTQLVALDESSYAMSYVQLPNQFASSPQRFNGISVQAPLVAGPDGNLYAWTMFDQGDGDPNIHPQGFFGVTASGRIVSQSTYNYNDIGYDSVHPTGLTTGADGNLWAAVNWSSFSSPVESAIYEFTPLHASRVRQIGSAAVR